MRLTLAAAALVLAVGPAASAEAMICSNGMHDYQMKFDPVSRRLFNNGLEYKILAVEKRGGDQVVVGLTVGQGPTYQAYFGERPRVLYYSDNKLYQTDQCH